MPTEMVNALNGMPPAGAKSKRAFVDSHMHLWDVALNPWYHFPLPGNDFGLGLREPFPDTYRMDDYLASTKELTLTKCVHVTAVTNAGDIEAESAWIKEIARTNDIIRAIIGTVDLSQSPSAIEATLDRECVHPLYRGIRVLQGLDYQSPRAQSLLRALASRGLVYDAVAHSDGSIEAAARALRQHEDLVVVLEHTGWPAALGDHAFREWRREIQQFAKLPNTFCKLSGLGMVIHSTRLDLYKPYFSTCVDLFGANRCMFASNFPVDLSYGSSSDLLSLFDDFSKQYSSAEAAMLFERSAESVYRI